MRALPAVVANPSASEATRASPPTIYLDNLATTPVDPRVLEAMLPYFTERFGNAASTTHAYGLAAAEAVEAGRAQIADLVGASPGEIVFTSGATEANNLAIKGVADYCGGDGGHIITSATEHPAVLDCCARLESRGFQVSILPVDADGLIDLDQLQSAIGDATVLVSIMAANNEIGTVQQLRSIGRITRERGVLWHCDAAQAVGKIPLDVRELGMDLLSMSAHKMYGPKGQGALYIRKGRPRVRLLPQLEGGGQERGLRSGTANVPGVVGMGRASEICRAEMDEESVRIAALRDRLHDRLRSRAGGQVALNGHGGRRLPGCLNLAFGGLDGASLIAALRDVAISSGSACTSGATEPSHVLKAIGRDDAQAFGSLRFGIGRFNTELDVDLAADRVLDEIDRQRQDQSQLAPAVAGA